MLAEHFVDLRLSEVDFADLGSGKLVGDASGCGLRDDELGEHGGVDEIHWICLHYALIVVVGKLTKNMKIDVTILNLRGPNTSVIKGKWSNSSLSEEWARKMKLKPIMVEHLVHDWS